MHQIRLFLRISPDTEVVIERYSDSASSFVVLDSNNVPVYKQLYRAAKAKSKLKLRVSTPQLLPKTAPKPVTVEDEPEASVAETYESTEKNTPTESEAAPSTTGYSAETPVPSTAPSSVTLLSGVELPLRTSSSVAQPEAAEAPKVDKEAEAAPAAQTLPANFAQSAPFDPQSIYSSFQEYCAPAAQSYTTIAPTPFAVCCNHCEKTVSDVHYHCQTCDDGDFDLCQACVDRAIGCYDDNHWLIKRTMVDGQLVASKTERIEPKSFAKKRNETLVQQDSVLESIEKSDREEPAPVQAARSEPVEEPPVKKEAVEEPVRAADVAPAFPRVPFVDPAGARWSCLGNMRTCNCCVQGLSNSPLHPTECMETNDMQNFPSPSSSTAQPARTLISARFASPRMPMAITPSMPLLPLLRAPRCRFTLP